MKKTLLTSVIFCMITSSAVALATEPTGGAAAVPPPPPAPEATPDGAAAAPTTASPATTPPASDKQDKPATDPGGRVRWGVSPSLGWHLPQPMFTLGGEGHVGYQISNALSVYGALGGTAGFFFNVNVNVKGAKVEASALSYWYIGAIAEYMLKDIFYVGGGFALARGAIVAVRESVDSAGVAEITEMGAAGFKPALNVRFGLGFGKPKPGSFRRGGFNLGFDGMLLFHPNAVFVTTKADGPNGSAGASVTETSLGATFVPMLTLGYDSR